MSDGTIMRQRARPLSQEELKGAAERIAERFGGDRDAVTVRSVRSEVGSGSLETIARFLRGWRQSAVAPLPVPRADLMPEDRDRLVEMAEQMLGVLIERERKLRERETIEHERSLRDAEREIERLTIQLGETGEEADRLTEAVQSAQANVQDLRSQVDTLTQERDGARRVLAETNEELGEARTELQTTRETAKAADLAAARATGERDQIARDLAEAAAKIRQLEEQATALAGDRDGARRERDEWMSKAQTTANALEVATTARQSAESEARSAREAAARAEGQLEGLRTTVAQLTAPRPKAPKAAKPAGPALTTKRGKDRDHGGAP